MFYNQTKKRGIVYGRIINGPAECLHTAAADPWCGGTCLSLHFHQETVADGGYRKWEVKTAFIHAAVKLSHSVDKVQDKAEQAFGKMTDFTTDSLNNLKDFAARKKEENEQEGTEQVKSDEWRKG